MKKVKFASCSRVFSEPFVEQPDYYKTATYEDVFKEVKEDINNNFYTKTFSGEDIRLQDGEDLTLLLKWLVPQTPDLFEANSPGARKLVAHFGKLIGTSYYGQTSKERQKAKDAINDILNNKHPYAKYGKVHIQPFLSLNDMCAYIHRITNYLRDNAILLFRDRPNASTAKCLKTAFIINTIKDPEILKALQDRDKRFMEVIKKGYMGMLINKPKELTITLVANFLKLTPKGLKQQLKEERRHTDTCHLDW